MSDLYKSVLRRAKKHVAEMDKTDGSSVTKFPTDMALRTIMTAIQTGIQMKDWSCVGDAMVMLQQIEPKFRPDGMDRAVAYLDV